MKTKRIISQIFAIWTICAVLFGSLPLSIRAEVAPPPPVITIAPAPVITAPPPSNPIESAPAPVITAPPAPVITAPPDPIISIPTPTPISQQSETSQDAQPGQSAIEPSGGMANNSNEAAGGGSDADTGHAENPGATSSNESVTGGRSTVGNNGDTVIMTGTGTGSGFILTQGNQNQSASVTNGTDGVTVSNVENGSNTANSASVLDNANGSVSQINSAGVANELTVSTRTGDTTVSKNTGGNATIQTGDANVTGTVISAVNTNVNGVLVSEFNVNENHTGDIILESPGYCIGGCPGQNGVSSTVNYQNGTNSDNAAVTSNYVNTAVFQNNDAQITGNMTLTADSGNNIANQNTDGNTGITTGDATVSANALTFANNNIDGAVVYSVVNIYGTLTGDIVYPQEQMSQCCTGRTQSVTNADNGTDSSNTATDTTDVQTTTNQNNNAAIDNTVSMDAKTGNNLTSLNTNGSSSVETGDTATTANVVTIANNNVTGNNWWLVFVNVAGQWIGKIMGSPDGSTMAGSQGTEFTVNGTGDVTVSNGSNGTESTNTADADSSTTHTVSQNNTATVGNTMTLSASTGNNSASQNTGGSNTVSTGDAKIIANIVNFVNNNITGGGNLIVTVVNVFGKWIGDFVGPGQKKEMAQAVQQHSTVITAPSNINYDASIAVTPTVPVSTASETAGHIVPRIAPIILSASRTNSNRSLSTRNQQLTKVSDFYPKTGNMLTDNAVTQPAIVKGRTVVKINVAYLLYAVPVLIVIFVLKRITNKLSHSK